MPNDEDLSLAELEAAIASEQSDVEAGIRAEIESRFPLKVEAFLGDFEQGDVEGSIAGRFQATSSDPRNWPSGNYQFFDRPTGLTCTPESTP